MAAAVVPILLAAHASAEGSPEASFAAQARRLEASSPLKDRLEAIAWLIEHHKQPLAAQAMPALVRCVQQDVSADVRGKAAEALALIAYEQKPRVCPLTVIEAFEDRDREVRSLAAGASSMFRVFAPGSVDVLLRCMKNTDPDTKLSAMYILGRVYGKDRKVLEVLRAATADRDIMVRHNAHLSLFTATENVEEEVRYCLRTRLELADEEALPADASEAQKSERFRENMIRLSTLSVLQKFAEEKTDAVARLVLAQLDDPDRTARRAAVLFLDDYAAAGEEVRMLVPTGLGREKPLSDKDREKEALSMTRTLVARLHELKVEDRLRKMSEDDPSQKVRTAAAAALKTLRARR
jgi:hypothetical protein